MNKSELDFFKLNLIYAITISLLCIVFAISYLGLITSQYFSTFLVQILILLIIPIILYVLLFKPDKKQIFEHLGIKKVNYKVIILSIILGFLLFILNMYIAGFSQTIIYLFGYENVNSGSAIYTMSGFYIDIILTCLLPAICEEILHRGIILRGINRLNKPILAIILSSLFFGFSHLNILQFFYTFILGLFMGIIVLASNSLIPAMIIHFMNNFLSIYISYGSHLDFPLVNLFSKLETIFIQSSVVLTFLMLMLLFTFIFYLVFIIINKIYKIQKPNIKFFYSDKSRFSNISKLSMIYSIVLGIMLTTSTFIWGIL